jgi:hypothetical protein
MHNHSLNILNQVTNEYRDSTTSALSSGKCPLYSLLTTSYVAVYDLENTKDEGKEAPGKGCCCTQGFDLAVAPSP